MADWDGLVGSFGLNNFYLFRAAGGGPFRIVPWDEDNAFHALGYPVDADHDKHVLMRRTMQVPELRQLFFDTLHRVSQLAEARESDQGPTWLEREINRRRDLIAARLHDDLVKPHHDDDFVREVAANVDFARNRAAVVREQLQRLQQGQASRAR
jgi:hypothetical protein